jgi:prepilin-type N-terminal cleavage/methylation domain-containing protein
MNRNLKRMRADHQGFTLVETMVVLVAFGLIIGLAFGMFSTISSTTVRSNQVARSQAAARVALDEIERTLRSAGAEVDLAGGQQHFVWAGPYQLAFNANLTPTNDPDGTGTPAAIVAGAADAGVPSDDAALYFPPTSYATGAETVMFSIDSNRDALVNEGDRGDDLEEESVNPNDYVLYRGIYGSAGGVNTVDHRPIALVRGPEVSVPGEVNRPLFSYWLDTDDDPMTPPVLAGDGDADGEVTSTEAMALGPLGPRDRARIERITVTVTAETDTKDRKQDDHNGYSRVQLSTDVKVRQLPRSAATIYGTVFRDINADGVHGPGEPTIPDVEIRTSTGAQTITNALGQYLLTINPGKMIITEVDPIGYSSTTSNSRTIDAYAGSFTRIDFGDLPAGGTAQVEGIVFNDIDQNGVLDVGDNGISNVKIFADTGEFTYTDKSGRYILDVPVGSRTISEVDSVGYMSTTPNIVDAAVPNQGDVAKINFGDAMGLESGTLTGYVFQDDNRDGIMDKTEGGVFGATIIADQVNSTQTDPDGYFSMTLPVGTYRIFENDPAGFSSTTPNQLTGVLIEADKTTTVYFGDIVQSDVEFDVIELADTEKALSIAAGDLREDKTGDLEIILGTRFSGGVNNMLIWENKRVNSQTPNSAIFDVTPAITRASHADVTELLTADFEGDRDFDIVAGHATPVLADLTVWNVDAGMPGEIPAFEYRTFDGEIVRDMQLYDANGDGRLDLVVAVDEVGFGGHVEVWAGTGKGEFVRPLSATITSGADPSRSPLLTVTAARMADINYDGLPDIVIADYDEAFASRVHIFMSSAIGGPSRALEPYQMFYVKGQVTHIHIGDQVEDDRGDQDILLAVQTSETTGYVELWLQHEDAHFGMISESSRVPNDRMLSGGAPISMVVMRLDNDIFPDVIVGTRRNTGFEGTVEYAHGFGHLLSESVPTTDVSIGAVLTMVGADFNLDGVTDLAVGTQNASTAGKVLVFYRR